MPLSLQTVIKEYVNKLHDLYGGHLKRVILYGSYARGDFTKDSDVDIMVLVDLQEDDIKQYGEALSDFTFDINMEKDLLLMPIVKNEEHFKYWENAYPFYRNVNQEGISLYAA
ncbi:MAG: nucleotidyltransferase domain-containing protein [Lachnospiraceae bacterium]|jgi:predicted nucleotidyltransferase|nr:nucleotidyltransferase domain-containing protein [Lachnospiraceae bacterium]